MEKTRLSQDEWRRVEEVYHEALEHRAESGAAFVTAACGGDSSLRREVESLLAGDGAPALVDQPAMDIAAELLDDSAPLAPGTELGPYRIESLIECASGSGVRLRPFSGRETADTSAGKRPPVHCLTPWCGSGAAGGRPSASTASAAS